MSAGAGKSGRQHASFSYSHTVTFSHSLPSPIICRVGVLTRTSPFALYHSKTWALQWTCPRRCRYRPRRAWHSGSYTGQRQTHMAMQAVYAQSCCVDIGFDSARPPQILWIYAIIVSLLFALSLFFALSLLFALHMPARFCVCVFDISSLVQEVFNSVCMSDPLLRA